MGYKNLLLSLAIIGISAVARVYAIDVSSGIGISASVKLLSNFDYSLYECLNNNIAVSTSTMYFSIQTATSPSNGDTNQYLANQYVAITVNDNAVSWRLRVYTNNFNDAPNPAVWGYNYGGLVNAQLALIATMGWYCTASNTIPNTGNPQFPATTGWKNFLDKMDADNPSTGSVNESFSSMDDGGYTNIAYGTGSYTRVIRPNIAGPQSVSLNKFNDTFYLYLEAGTPPNTDMNATYNATVVMDLIHQ